MSKFASDKAETYWEKKYSTPLSEQNILPEYKNGYLTGFAEGYIEAIAEAIKEIYEKYENKEEQ